MKFKIVLFPRRAASPEFRYPSASLRRTLVIDGRLRVRKPSVMLSAADPRFIKRACAFHPESIAASFAQLLELDHALGDSLRPTHALIVFSGLSSPLLTPADRDYLWSLYEVPIFEQILDSAGNLIACECEAHSGLHLLRPWPQKPPLELVSGQCECGQVTDRLLLRESVRVACAS